MELKTSLDRGLTKEEAENRLKEYGQNQLEKEEEESLWDKIKESFEDLLVRILLLAAVISFIIALFGKYYGFYFICYEFGSNFLKFEKFDHLVFRNNTLSFRDYLNLKYWSLMHTE